MTTRYLSVSERDYREATALTVYEKSATLPQTGTSSTLLSPTPRN